MSLAEQTKIQKVINKFQSWFSDPLGYTHVLSHEMYTSDNPPVKQKFYICIRKIEKGDYDGSV